MALVDQLRENRRRLLAEMESIITAARAQNRNLSASEVRRFNDLEIEVVEIDERISELEVEAEREGRAAELRRRFGLTDVDDAGLTYRRRGPQLIADMISARHGDVEAAARLAAHRREAEQRGLSTAAGAGGEFAPPLWLIDQYTTLARPARVVADLLHKETLPSGISSINIPAATGGTAVAVQASQNTSVVETDLTTGSLSSGIVTIAGKQVVSLQLVEQSGIPIDQIVGRDLLLALAAEVDRLVLLGSGSNGEPLGLLNMAGVNSVTFTSSSPQVASSNSSDSLLAAITAASDAIHEGVYVAPNSVIMHPRRWAWILASVDTTNRPLITPSASFNAVGDVTATAAQGRVGTLAGLDVYVDPQIPTDRGAGQNEDVIIVGKFDEAYLWESTPTLSVFDAPYADSMGVLIRAHEYVALIPNRRPKAFSVISGTGLIAPTV